VVKKIYLLLLAACMGFLFGCVNPSIKNIKPNNLQGLNSELRIFIPRFEGNPNFVEESTDYFITLLEAGVSHQIDQGDSLRYEGADISSGSNIAHKELAFRTARKNGYDLVILGKVTSHNTGGMVNGFNTVRVYNVATGKLVANFHNPSGLLIAYSEHQCVMAATQETANDVVAMLSEYAAK